MKRLLFVAAGLLLNASVEYARNRVFARRIRFLEDLLHAPVDCTFNGLYSFVRTSGTYQGQTIEYSSRPFGPLFHRSHSFRLRLSHPAPQEKLMVSYPLVADEIRHVGRILSYTGGAFQRPTRDQATMILDKLVLAARSLAPTPSPRISSTPPHERE